MILFAKRLTGVESLESRNLLTAVLAIDEPAEPVEAATEFMVEESPESTDWLPKGMVVESDITLEDAPDGDAVDNLAADSVDPTPTETGSTIELFTNSGELDPVETTVNFSNDLTNTFRISDTAGTPDDETRLDPNDAVVVEAIDSALAALSEPDSATGGQLVSTTGDIIVTTLDATA